MASQPPPTDPYGTPSPEDNNGDALPRYPGDAQPPSYPSSPYQPSNQGRPPSEPPSPIRTAFILMYVGAALQVIGIVTAFMSRDDIRAELVTLQDETDLSASDIDAMADTFVGALATAGIVAVAIWILMAHANRRGRRWARIVATVLGALNVLATLVGLSLLAGSAALVSLISVGLVAVILFLLYRPDSTAYYSAVSNQPRF